MPRRGCWFSRGPERGRGQCLLFLLLLFLPLFLPSLASSQEHPVVIRVAAPDETQELHLRDGSTLYGRVTRTGDPFTFQLLSGTVMEFTVSQVSYLRPANGDVEEGEFWRKDPNETRLFFGPTARPLKKGSGYFAVYEVFMPFLGVGLTDKLILAGGTPLWWGDGGDRPFWLAPKYTFLDSGATQVAVGVLAFVVDDHSAGIVYGVLSQGGPKASATLGLGYGYVDDDLADTPAVMFGGELRAGKGIKLLTENYLFPGGGGILSLGPRFFGERLSADLGLMAPFGWDDGFFVWPLVNFVWNF